MTKEKVEAVKKLNLKELIQSRTKGDSSKNKFWKKPVHIIGFGICTGAVKLVQLEAFLSIAPQETDLGNWIGDFDPIAKREADARAKMKQKAGLKE